MDSNPLLTAAVEMALDLLEKEGTFIPYCQAVTEKGEKVIYSPASDEEFTEADACENLRDMVCQELPERGFIALAFCRHTRIRLSGSPDKVPAVEVELHCDGEPPAVWHFAYTWEDKTAVVIETYTSDAQEDIFGEG